MNKQIKVLLILVLVAVAIYFVFVRKPWRSIGGDETAFDIKDTAAVTRIFLADVREGKVLLTRGTAGSWMVDDKFAVDERKVNLLLQTMHDVKMRNPISQAEYNTVIRELTASGIKAEFYSGDDMVKTIYVGQATGDQSGTYMMIEGASTPYVVHIPGFVGYLTPRFPTNPVKWKSKLVFDVPETDVKTITVQYPITPEESFLIDNSGAAPVMKTMEGANVVADANFLKYYVASFKQLFGEAYDDAYTATAQDSIFRSDAFCRIVVSTKSGKEQSVQLHIKGLDKRTKQRYDEQGNPLPFDTEKYYGFANGDKNMMYIQQYNFGRVLRKRSEFAASAAKANR